MQMNVEKFLALTALLAAATLPGCTVETVNSGDHAGAAGLGTAGSAGGSAGAAGSSGAAGSASTEGTDDGGTADSSADASVVACFAEGAADAGPVAESICDTLPYASSTCTDDAGAEGGFPLGLSVCAGLKDVLKPSAFAELMDCLTKAPNVADGGQGDCTAHDAAAALCSTSIFNRSTCTVPDAASEDGGALGCAQIVASCPANDAGNPGITLAQCQRWLSPMNAAARQAALSCGIDPSLEGAADCADKFENVCVFPPLP